MKYLRINITAGEQGKMIYPVNYEQEIGKFAADHLYFEDGKDYDLMLCIYDYNFSDSMIREGVTEITEAEAKQISETAETRTEVIVDEAKLRRIELLVRMGRTLSKEDADCIDPASPTCIFSSTPILADKIEVHKQVEAVTLAKMELTKSIIDEKIIG